MSDTKPTHVSVTVVISQAELEDFENAEANRRQLGEQVWATALRKLPAIEKPEWVEEAVANGR